MNPTGLRRIPPDQLSGSGHTFGTPRHPSIKDPILSKRVCFYKSGDPQFSGLRMVINNRTFKTFDALLDNLSKKVPLPFGVRNITTPRGVHAIYSLDELEDGKSYICSDRRKVKPINLAQAGKKLAPWYHARPATARRRAKMQAKSFPGRNIPRQEQVVVRTPKKLLVFRNGEPTFKRKVVLHKKTTANFQSILGYISEMMQFNVVKLHTLDGRRVDGLPGLILSSGIVVAAGREPFKSANYNSQTSPASTQFSSKRKSRKRSKSSNRKKKTLSYQSSKSRNFSLSSERYIVDRIHNSMAGSSYDGPTNSVELESSQMLESVVETEGDGAEAQGCLLPAEDDIEKSFRVNQDGSMTVEMKVRLTLKEEETIHWTTTLSRSSVANDIDESDLPEPVADEEMSPPKPESLDLQSPASSNDSVKGDKSKDNDEDPPTPSSGALSRGSKEEENNKVQTNMASATRVPTPGYNHISKKQASVESIKSLTTDGFQGDVVGSYSYTEQTQNGGVTEQYCVVKRSSKKPVPKPRRLGSVDSSNMSRNISSFKSSDVLQIESSGEEVTETVLHIYEQQTCQDNFLANICAHDSPLYGRPATSETGQFSNSEHWIPSTASESISIWRTENMSQTSDFTLSSLKTTNGQQQYKSANGEEKSQQREVKKRKRKPKRRRVLTPVKRDPESRTKAKTFSSAGYIKKIYGTKSKSAKSTKLKQKGPQKGSPDATTKHTLKHPKSASPPKENQYEVSVETQKLEVASTEMSRGTLTRQTSVHHQKKKSGDVSESKALQGSGTIDYVQHWLEKAQNNSSSYPGKENGTIQAEIRKQDAESGFNQGVTSEIQPSQTLTSETSPERTSVKLRVKCFETKLSSPSVERKVTTNMEHRTSMAQTQEAKPLMNGVCHEMSPSPLKISLQQATPYNTMSMEFLPPPPPPEELEELTNAERCMMDVSSAASSPLYQISSLSSQMSDNHPSSPCPMSDKATSPTHRTMETPVQGDVPSLRRAPSVKRAPLVSNQSLERKMSLRKASLSKYTLGTEDGSDTSAPNRADDASNVLPNSICAPHLPPIKTQAPNGSSDQRSTPSNCTSASSISVTSEVRMSSDSISSTETPVPSDAKLVETKPSHKEAMSPKPQQKKVMISPSQNRKSQSKISSSDVSADSPQLSSRHGHHSDKAMSPSIAKRQHAAAPSPLTERRKMLSKAKLQKRQSPYSQSLDVASPPVTNKSHKKKLSRNLSREYASEGEEKSTRKTSPRKKRSMSQLINSTTEREETPTNVENKSNPDRKESEKQSKLVPSNVARQPHMKPVPVDEETPPASDSNTSARFKESIDAVIQEEKANVDVRNMIETFASQTKESDMQRIPQRTVTLRQKLPAESRGPTHSTALSKKDDAEDLNSCKDKDLAHTEESIHDTESGVDEEGQRISGASKDPENCKDSTYSSHGGEEEEEEEAESVMRPEGSESEEYVMLGVRSEVIPSPDPQHQTLSEEEQTEESEIQRVGVDENAGNSDVEEPTCSEEEFESHEQRFRREESSMHGIEEERESSDEEDHPPVPVEVTVTGNKLKALIEEEEEGGSEDDHLNKGAGSLIQSPNLARSNRCCTDEDSRNNHGSWKEQTEDAAITLGQIRCFEEPSSCAKECGSDKEEDHCETPATQELQSEETKCESVAERVNRLEKQVADEQKRKSVAESPALKRVSQRTVLPESDIEDAVSETPSSRSALCARSAAQSSLSFSYDSSGVITTEPEGNRVKSIREMFLAKGTTDVQLGHKRQPSPSAPEQKEDTSASGGYQSQTSPELSSGEDDSARKSITKGFVRRTIERLYGKKDPDEVASERPPSASKQKRKEHSGFFSPLHSARTKAMSELSYFNSSNALDTLTEATRCIAFNAQVGPGDSVPIDDGRWLVREDALIRKSVSDPVAINKTPAGTPPSEERREDTEQNAPYSLFSSTPEPEEKTKALWRKCTYFSLPHANDSDVCQDELSLASKNAANGDTITKDHKDSGEAKTRGERNGILPAAGDFKLADNKVHPADGEVVVKQPARGQGAVNRRLQEPDILDLLYNFCGENCPIL